MRLEMVVYCAMCLEHLLTCVSYATDSAALFLGGYTMILLLEELRIPSRIVFRTAFLFLAVVRAHPCSLARDMPLLTQCLHVLRRTCAEAHYFVMFRDLVAAVKEAVVSAEMDVNVEMDESARAKSMQELEAVYENEFRPLTNVAFSQLLHLMRWCSAWFD